MLSMLLISLLFAQIPVRPAEGGTITGVLKNTEGKPAAGVRIAAVTKPPEAALDITAAATMSSLGETDSEGRFKLESVPPGNYYIAAGRVDFPTYYPGTQTIYSGKLIEITPGAEVALEEFVMTDASIRPPSAEELAREVLVQIPVQIRVENGEKLPIFSTTGQTLLWLNRVNSNQRVGLQMTGTSMGVPVGVVTGSADYRATVENLPEGYAVKSIMFDQDNVTSSTFSVKTKAPLPSLTVSLMKTPSLASTAKGVRVTGRIGGKDIALYLSGKPANLYSDGTFEFVDVPPGRHAIVVPDRPSPPHTLGASIVVGERDVNGVELVAVSVLPFAPRAAAQPGPSGNHPVGSVVPLASLRGRVLDEATRRPIADGTATLLSFSQAVYNIGTNGDFEIPKLFPGNYNLQIEVPGRTTLSRKVTIGDDDVTVELIMGAM